MSIIGQIQVEPGTIPVLLGDFCLHALASAWRPKALRFKSMAGID